MKTSIKLRFLIHALLILFFPFVALAQNADRVKQRKVDLGDYTDSKLNETFLTFEKENKLASILILSANGFAGKSAFTQKVIYDREKKHLLLLKRTLFQTIPSPTTSYSWILWRGVEPSDLAEGLPWWSERIKADMSKPTEDGRTTLPNLYPQEPVITAWP